MHLEASTPTRELPTAIERVADMRFRKAFDEALRNGLALQMIGRPTDRALQALGDFLGSNVDPNAGPTQEERDACTGFVSGHVLGEVCALRRASVALSDPRARGVEQAVIGYLAEGLDIEDALRKASARPEPHGSEEDRVVIPFPCPHRALVD